MQWAIPLGILWPYRRTSPLPWFLGASYPYSLPSHHPGCPAPWDLRALRKAHPLQPTGQCCCFSQTQGDAGVRPAATGHSRGLSHWWELSQSPGNPTDNVWKWPPSWSPHGADFLPLPFLVSTSWNLWPMCWSSGLEFSFFQLHHMACGIFVPQPGIKALPPALKMWSLNHLTTREVLFFFFF